MEKIKITSDSICDLSPELLAAHDIGICPLIINLGDESQPDGPGLNEKIYAYAERTKSTPKTAAISTAEYVEYFRQNKPADGTLIHFNISSDVSSTHFNAVAAAKEVPGVYVIDSRSLSSGTGLLILRAVKYRAAGLTAPEIVAKINANINQIQCSFMVKDLTYLHRGGRCSGTARLFAAALHIKPQIILREGKMMAGKKYMGSFEGCLKKYVNDTLNTFNNPDLSYCFITHTKMDNPALVDMVRAQVLAKYPFENIVEVIASGTITSHCGPNTLGILYGLQENV